MIPPDLHNTILELERLAAEVQKIRNPSNAKPWWETAGMSAMATAVATVIVTSVASYMTQQSLNRRQVAVAQQEGALTRRREAMESTYKALGLVMRSTHDRVLMARGHYDKFPDKEIADRIAETNLIDRDWRQRRGQYELEMHVLFGGDRSVADAWNGARIAVEAYVKCAEDTYEANQGERAPATACNSDSTAAVVAMRSLLNRFEQHYRTADSLGR